MNIDRAILIIFPSAAIILASCAAILWAPSRSTGIDIGDLPAIVCDRKGGGAMYNWDTSKEGSWQSIPTICATQMADH